MSTTTLKSVFGPEEIGDLVRKFNFAQNETGQAVPFAPLYGPLNREKMQQLKPEDRMLIAAVTRSIQKVEKDKWNFDTVLEVLMQNPFVQPANDKNVVRSDTLHTETTEFAKFDGSPDADIVSKAWFVKLVDDEEVVRTIGVGAEAVAKVVAQSGATATGLESAFHKEEKHSKVFDTTFLNFPDPADPYFKLHNVKLNAWSKSDRTGLLQTDTNGITGDYRVRAFTYRADIVSNISEAARDRALEFSTGLFE